MGKRNHKYVCASKVRHETISSALLVIEMTNTQTSQDYYLCDNCGKYHVFTIDKQRYKRQISKNNASYRKEEKIKKPKIRKMK